MIRTEPGFQRHIVKGDLLLKVVADVGNTVRNRVAAGGQTAILNRAGCGSQQAVEYGSDPPGHVRLGDCEPLAEDIADILKRSVSGGDRAGGIRAGMPRSRRHGQYYAGTLRDFPEICPCQYTVEVEPDCRPCSFISVGVGPVAVQEHRLSRRCVKDFSVRRDVTVPL